MAKNGLTKYHLDPNGTPVPCPARIRCRVNGGDSPHGEFANMNDARSWAEEELAKEFGYGIEAEISKLDSGETMAKKAQERAAKEAEAEKVRQAAREMQYRKNAKADLAHLVENKLVSREQAEFLIKNPEFTTYLSRQGRRFQSQGSPMTGAAQLQSHRGTTYIEAGLSATLDPKGGPSSYRAMAEEYASIGDTGSNGFNQRLTYPGGKTSY